MMDYNYPKFKNLSKLYLSKIKGSNVNYYPLLYSCQG